MSNFLKALSVFVGTVIGVGIFGLPWVAFKSGFFVLIFYFLIVGSAGLVIHLLLSDIIIGTKGRHRFPGYAYLYLGKNWGRIAFLAMCFGLSGAQLAYLIIGGTFLGGLFSPFFGESILIPVLIFFTISSLLIYKGIKGIALTEFLTIILLFVLFLIFAFQTVPKINFNNYFNFNIKNIILPYGVVTFALWGSSILPEVKEILKGKRRDLRKVIYIGAIIVALAYLLFTAFVYGVSGTQTSEDAFLGLSSQLGENIIKFGFIFGLITCFSSFLTLGLTLKKVLIYDMRFSEKLSWLIACFVPLVMFLLGLRKFIDVISLTGALAVGLEGFLMILIYRAFLLKKKRRMSPLYFLLSLFFFLGVVAEIYYFFS
jgi:tyrosine-specific transport protein